MQIEFDFGDEVAITPAIAGDLWPEIVAMSEDPETFAEEGEAFFEIGCAFIGEQCDEDSEFFEAQRVTVDRKPCPEHLALFFENQLRRQYRDNLDAFILNYAEYRHWPEHRAWADIGNGLRYQREAEAKRRAALDVVNTLGVL